MSTLLGQPWFWLTTMLLLGLWMGMSTYAKTHPGEHSAVFSVTFVLLTLGVLAGLGWYLWALATLLASLNS